MRTDENPANEAEIRPENSKIQLGKFKDCDLRIGPKQGGQKESSQNVHN